MSLGYGWNDFKDEWALEAKEITSYVDGMCCAYVYLGRQVRVLIVCAELNVLECDREVWD